MVPNDDEKRGRSPSGSDSIVDGRLYVAHDLSPTMGANAALANDAARRAHFASQLMVYDRIVIPTSDFGVVPALLQWAGEKRMEELLEEEAVSFLRLYGLIGYAGAGNGLVSFEITPGEGTVQQWWQKALWGDLEAAVYLQIQHLASSVSVKKRRRFVKLVMAASQLAKIEGENFDKNLANESYNDVMGTPALRDEVERQIPRGVAGPVSLKRLPGIQDNQLRVAVRDEPGDAIDLLLRVAELNRDLLLAKNAGNADLTISPGASAVLQYKLRRTRPALADLFASLLDLNRVPDLRRAVESDSVSVEDVWKLRKTARSRRFREWLRKADATSGRELERMYVEALGRKSWVQSLPARILRFVLSTGAGVANPSIGLGVGAADSFLVEQLLGGYSPKLMIDDMRRLIPVDGDTRPGETS